MMEIICTNEWKWNNEIWECILRWGSEEKDNDGGEQSN
jgi:hypothetical protein